MSVEQVSSGGTITYLHHDQAGSTRLLTSTTGAKEASFTFDAYGNKTGSTGTSTTPLGYDSQYTSTDTALVYMRARSHDPATAQFLSVDPLMQDTRALYFYAGDNPNNAIDPSGLFCLSLSWSCAKEDAGGLVRDTARGVSTLVQASPVGQAVQVTGLSLGGCVGANAGLGGAGSVSLCYMTTPSGQSCVTATHGSGKGVGLGVSATGSVSNAQNCSGLGGLFGYENASFGSYSASAAYGNDGCGAIAVGGLGVGFGPPGFEGGLSETEIFSSYG